MQYKGICTLYRYGALDIQPMKQKVQRQRQKKEPLGEAKKPREVRISYTRFKHR